MELEAGRSSSGFGMNPLSSHDFLSFIRLYRVRLNDFELGTLRALDRARLAAASPAPTGKGMK